MTVTLMKTPAETAYTEAFNPQGVLADVRKSAFAQFAETGLPHRRMEDWKWTDLRQLMSRALPPVSGTTASADTIDALIAGSPFGDVARALGFEVVSLDLVDALGTCQHRLGRHTAGVQAVPTHKLFFNQSGLGELKQ